MFFFSLSIACAPVSAIVCLQVYSSLDDVDICALLAFACFPEPNRYEFSSSPLFITIEGDHEDEDEDDDNNNDNVGGGVIQVVAIMQSK